MRVRGKSRLSVRTSKRKNEAESSTTAASEPQPKRMSRRNEDEQKEPSSSKTKGATVSSSIMVDKYCWICHTETDDKICVTCHRAFHHACLKDKKYTFSELGVCTECQSKSVTGTELSSTRFLNIEKLKIMLDVLTRRSFGEKEEKDEKEKKEKRKKNEPFLRWQEDKRDELFKIIDFEILLDNINHDPPYTNTAEFYGDILFIYHNSCIAYGAISDEAKAAENLRKDFKTELLDLEDCPECYFQIYCNKSDSYDPFIRLCDTPHDIVWAQLKRQSYWPAKCLKVVKDVAHVRFFGKHEQSNIPIKQCFFMSKSHPKDENSNIYSPENSGLKLKLFQPARIELLEYVRLYELQYGHFPFYPHQTLYKLQEKQNEVIITSAEGSLPRNVIEMKFEEIVDDPEENFINAATVMEFSEENLNSVTNDIRSPNGGLCTNSPPVTFSTEENLQSPTEASVQETETLENNASDHFTLPSRSSDGFNPSRFMENQDDLDTEVQCIGQKSNIQENSAINPDIILDYHPALTETFQQMEYYMKSLFVCLWANCTRNSASIGRMSKMGIDLRRCRSALEKLSSTHLELEKKNEENNKKIKNLTDQLIAVESENKRLHQEVLEERALGNARTKNANTVIKSLKDTIMKKVEEKLNKQYSYRITEDKRKIKQLEEEKRILEKAEEKAKKNKQGSNDIDDIRKFKINHYCKVCEQSAAFTCCLNTSYCSPECLQHDAEAHKLDCEKSQIVQQTVCKKFQIISSSYTETSTINNSLNSQEISVHQKED